MVARSAAPTSGTSRSRRHTSRFITVIRRIGDVAMTVAVRLPAGEDGDLAEHVARAERTDDGRVANDLRGAVRNREHRVAEVAFRDERIAGANLEVGAHLGDPVSLVRGHVREERDRRKAS